jgi:hypothetical protein
VDEDPPTPRQIGHPWLSVGTAYVLLESAKDISMARFRLELWDALPPPLDADWPASEIVTLSLPSGRLGVHQIAAGTLFDVFDVGGPGRYQVRLAWREGGEWDPEVVRPQAWLLAQFWRNATA